MHGFSWIGGLILVCPDREYATRSYGKARRQARVLCHSRHSVV